MRCNGAVSTYPSPVDLRVLGPLEVRVGGERLALGGRKQRVVLAMLVLEAGRVVSADRIVDAVWGDVAAERSTGTLHVYLSNLRRALEPAARALGVKDLIATERPGYVLHVDPELVDLTRFERAVRDARRAAEREDHGVASARFHEAMGLWGGTPLGDLADDEFAQGIVARLDGLRVSALEGLFAADLALGRHAEVLDRLPPAIAADPLNEHLRGIHMLALYRAGRQADALGAFRDAREVLVEELGIDPGPALRELEHRILAQDPTLEIAVTRVAAEDDAASTVIRQDAPRRAVLQIDGRPVELTRAVTTIGRRADRTVVLVDPDVSRNHCEIRRTAFGLSIVDTGSTNGTWVNDELVAERTLVDGDSIRVGNTTLGFALD